VRVSIDGELAPEFERAVNSVTVAMRKRHAGGAETLREMVLDRASAAGARDLRMVYGWDGDVDREAWLDYDVRTRWSFQGGARYDTPWQTRAGAVIDLFAPFERRTVRLAGDPARLAARAVRALVVDIRYPFFGETRRAQLLWRPGESLDDKALDITLPRDVFAVQAAITWILEDGRRLTRETSENPGIVFVDELPPEPIP
jgi:hypothetical protein